MLKKEEMGKWQGSNFMKATEEIASVPHSFALVPSERTFFTVFRLLDFSTVKGIVRGPQRDFKVTEKPRRSRANFPVQKQPKIIRHPPACYLRYSQIS